MDKSTRDEIIVQHLQTPRGKELFAAAFLRGVNQTLLISDEEGEVLIREFQEKYETTRGLPTYL
jgi:hypothetical protein